MKNSRRKKIILISSISLLFGIASLILGFLLPESANHTLSGIFCGIGAGISAPSLFYLMSNALLSDSTIEKLSEKKQIEKNDERNVKIREKTSYICYRIIFYCIILATIVLSFIKVDMIVRYIMISLIIIHIILELIVGCYYSKRM